MEAMHPIIEELRSAMPETCQKQCRELEHLVRRANYRQSPVSEYAGACLANLVVAAEAADCTGMVRTRAGTVCPIVGE